MIGTHEFNEFKNTINLNLDESILNTEVILKPYSVYMYGTPNTSAKIKKAIFNKPATIILWDDGTKTVSVCDKHDKYNKELGFAWCIMKKFVNNKAIFDMFSQHCWKENKDKKSKK